MRFLDIFQYVENFIIYELWNKILVNNSATIKLSLMTPSFILTRKPFRCFQGRDRISEFVPFEFTTSVIFHFNSIDVHTMYIYTVLYVKYGTDLSAMQ